MDPYLSLLVLAALLFFLPKVLVRLALPSPVTEMALGAVLGPLLLGVVEPNTLLAGLASFGISALFLFAGLEVEVRELVARRTTLLGHLGIQAALFAAASWFGVKQGLELSTSVLVAVAVLTPSAGFIVPVLDALGFPEAVTSWIKQKAIATELLAIVTVLIFSNTGSGSDLLVGVAGLAALFAALPLVFFVFHRTILRWAPRTEFSFMLIVALLAAYLTHHLGVHYLVGAFVVGVAARRYLDWCASQDVPVSSVRTALEAFRFISGFFVPFFFFVAGLHLPAGAFTARALAFAGSLLVIAIPVRVASVALHRRWSLRESWADALEAGFLLGPTTVFTVAVAEILVNRFPVPDWLYGGLILYAAATTLLPVLTRKVRSTEYEDLLSVSARDSRP